MPLMRPLRIPARGRVGKNAVKRDPVELTPGGLVETAHPNSRDALSKHEGLGERASPGCCVYEV